MIEGFYSPRAARSKYWDPYSQTLPREKLDERHLRQIQKLITFAYENAVFYRELYDKAGIKPEDIRSWDDFYRRVPFTDKPDFMNEQTNRPPFAVEALPREHAHVSLMTSGTTGVPMRMVYTRYDEVAAGDLYPTIWWDAGIRPGDSFYFCFAFGPWAGLWAAFWGCKRFGGIICSGSGFSTEERIKQIMSFRPSVVLGTPTYLLHMADVAQKMGVDLRQSGVKLLSGGGEPGFNIPVTRQVLMEKWGAKIGDIYGLGETVTAACECGANSGGVHLHEWNFHGYAADQDTGMPVPEGQIGEHIITCYRRLGQVFIKYRTHDLVQMQYHFDHGCGWTWAFLPGSVLGRTDYMIVIRGMNIFPTAIENLLGQVAGASHHYEIHITRVGGMDRVAVKVEAKEDVPAEFRAAVAKAATDVYRSNISLGIDVEVLAPGSLPRYELKSKRIFDHRPPEVRRKLER
ncbi:MAG: AMP-binding protein [Dehalococcoidia bacterium]|nr:AMP-binding protein [Dehalococcoidia bacterium]